MRDFVGFSRLQRKLVVGLFVLGLVPVAVSALPATPFVAASVPVEMRSSAFTITVNGKPVGVAHAAASYEFASFDFTSAKPGMVEVAKPIAIGANPCGARESVAPRMIIRNTNVSTNSAINADARL